METIDTQRGAAEVELLPAPEDSTDEELGERPVYSDGELSAPVHDREDPVAGCRGVLAGCLLVLPLIPLALYGAALLIKAGWALIVGR